MKHRAGSSKIKYEHHMIKGLREMLEKIEPWAEVISIIPGEIRPTKSHRPLILEVRHNTPAGVKCLARSGSAVQDVFIVTSKPDIFREHLHNFS